VRKLMETSQTKCSALNWSASETGRNGITIQSHNVDDRTFELKESGCCQTKWMAERRVTMDDSTLRSCRFEKSW
jgi:hypothetical protein